MALPIRKLCNDFIDSIVGKFFHISGLVFTFVIQIFGWYCQLTHLEVWLRAKHDPSLSYTGSFIIHYVEKLVYIELTREIVFVLTLMLVTVSAFVYLKKRKWNHYL